MIPTAFYLLFFAVSAFSISRHYSGKADIGFISSAFEDQIYTITRKIKVLALQINRLSEARDRLLPKLMSGEVEV